MFAAYYHLKMLTLPDRLFLLADLLTRQHVHLVYSARPEWAANKYRYCTGVVATVRYSTVAILFVLVQACERE